MKLNATAPEQPGISGVADEGVLETVSFGSQPAGDDQLGMPQRLQGRTETVFGHARGSSEKVVVEITPDRSCDLRNFFDRRKAIQSRCERIVQCRRDGQRRQRPCHPVPVAHIDQHAAFR